MTPKTSRLNPQLDTILPLPKRKERVFTFRVNLNIALTLLISILLHLSLLWLFAPKLFSMGAPQEDAPPLEISLGPPQKKQTAPSEEVLPDLRPLPRPPAVKPKPETKQNKRNKKTKQKRVPAKVLPKSTVNIAQKEALKKRQPKPVVSPTSQDPLPGEDMQAYVRRQKEAKLAKKGLSKNDIEEVLASNRVKSAGDKRDAKIRENLNLGGTNGIFTVRSLSAYRAQFSFKGWKNNINTARLELIDVEAGGVPIKLAVIRKMIKIIRREYSGNFKWDSRRLNRVKTLSARLEDTEELEAFMMLEIFGPGMPYSDY